MCRFADNAAQLEKISLKALRVLYIFFKWKII